MPKKLYVPFKSKAKNKRFSVYVKKNGKKTLINFGDKRYKINSSAKARKSYLARSAGIRDKQGRLTKNNKNTANYWSRKMWKA